MSYCRYGEADAYIYQDIEGGLVCCGCNLRGSDSEFTFIATGPLEMLKHVFDHRMANDYIPESVDSRLIEELSEQDNSIYDKSSYYLAFVKFNGHPSSSPRYTMEKLESEDSLKEYLNSLTNFHSISIKYVGF